MTVKVPSAIWVYGDRRNERLFGLSLNVLAMGRHLAARTGDTVCLVLAGAPGDASETSGGAFHCGMSLAAAAKAGRIHGADRVCILTNPALEAPRADTHAAALAQAAGAEAPRIVLFALTDLGRDLAARSAAGCRAGLIADCAELLWEDDRIVAVCPAWGGDILTRITFSTPHQTGFATVHPHAAVARAVTGGAGVIERVIISDPAVPAGVRLLSRSTEPASGRRLEDAERVVVGGAGLGDIEGFGRARELAVALDAQLGATRPPVLQHWVEETRLIGQTGKTIRPRLLISVGTSGAVQYTAGIQEAGTVVAINRDPKAPIFQLADIGIVADARSFLPLLTERIQRTVMRRLADDLCQDAGESGGGIGEKICRLREAREWSREELAQATGETPERIARFEEGRSAPSVGFLVRLAAVLKVDPSTFLGRQEKTMLRDQRAQAFVRRTRSYSYETLTTGGENDHLRAFMVTIEPRQAHKPVAYKHEGEEFIFVMEGALELTLGSKPQPLKAGESIHFNSAVPHKLKSTSSAPTRCLVVLYTL